MSDKSIQEQLRSESQKVVSELQTLRDEIKLKVHLANAEGKDAWSKLEPQLSQFEQRVGQAAEETLDELKAAGAELKTNVQKLYESLRK